MMNVKQAAELVNQNQELKAIKAALVALAEKEMQDDFSKGKTSARVDFEDLKISGCMTHQRTLAEWLANVYRAQGFNCGTDNGMVYARVYISIPAEHLAD